jgi:hypothetical protein
MQTRIQAEISYLDAGIIIMWGLDYIIRPHNLACMIRGVNNKQALCQYAHQVNFTWPAVIYSLKK